MDLLRCGKILTHRYRFVIIIVVDKMCFFKDKRYRYFLILLPKHIYCGYLLENLD